MPSRAQDCASAPAELRSSAVAFTPGEKVHMTPVKVSTPAAEDEDELCAWLREKACLHKVVIEKSLGKLHTEDVYDLAGLSVLHDLGGLRDVFSRVAASQIASALDRLTISNTEPALPAGLTTPPPRAASTAAVQGITGRGIIFDAAPESQQPEAAAENDRKETASLPEPTRTQMGGNGSSLEEKVEQAAPPSSTSEHVQGDAPQPVAVQSNHPESSPPDPATRTPSPYSAAELPHVGAPASSSPPVDSQPTPFKFDASFKAPPSKGPPFKFQAQQQQQEDSDSDSNSDDGTFPRLGTEDLKRFQAWQQQQRQRKPWKTSPSPPHGPVWYEKLPYDIKYSCRQWLVLEFYDQWLRGEELDDGCVIEDDLAYSSEFFRPDALDEQCEVDGQHRVCKACRLNLVLGNMLCESMCPSERFDDTLGRFVFPIDTRCRVETQFLAFASYGHEVPPRTAELKDLMLQAAREEHEENVRMNESRPKSERVDLWQWSSPSSWTLLKSGHWGRPGSGDDGDDGDDGDCGNYNDSDNDDVPDRDEDGDDQNMPAHA